MIYVLLHITEPAIKRYKCSIFDLVGKGDQKGGAKGEKTLNDFAVEYAKSNRSTCKGCEQKIEKVWDRFYCLKTAV